MLLYYKKVMDVYLHAHGSADNKSQIMIPFNYDKKIKINVHNVLGYFGYQKADISLAKRII